MTFPSAAFPEGPSEAPLGEASVCISALYERSLERGLLVAGRCRRCERFSFPPKTRCNHCQAADIEPIRLAGRGRLCNVQTDGPPQALPLGHIRLEHAITVRAPLVGRFRNPGALAEQLVDGPVEVVPVVIHTGGVRILAFKPV